MVRKVYLSLILTLCGTLMSEELKFYTENSGYNNYLDKDGSIKGHNTDIIRELLKRHNLKSEILLTTWSRAYGLIQTKPNIALFSMTRNSERNDKFKWVGPLHQINFVLYGLKSNKIQIDSLEQAKKVASIGCYKSDVRETYLLKNNFKNLSSLTGKEANLQNLQKLMSGRTQLWITSDHVIYKSCEQLDIDPSLIEKKYEMLTSYIYLAFSKNVSDETVAAFQKSLDEMKKDGTYKKIMMSYPTGKASMTFDKPTAFK